MSDSLQALGRAVKAAQYRHHRALDRALATVGTSLPQWDALRAIARHPGSSAHWLAGETFQSDQAFGTLANRLAAQELIARSAGGGRKVAHFLTSAGRSLLAQGNAIADRILGDSFDSLSAAERNTLRELLDRVGVAN